MEEASSPSKQPQRANNLRLPLLCVILHYAQAIIIPAICIGITYVERTQTLEEILHSPPIGAGLAQLVHPCIEAATLIAGS